MRRGFDWSIVICDSGGGVEKRRGLRWILPSNGSEIMILAALVVQVHRNPCLHVLSLQVCVRVCDHNSAEKVQGGVGGVGGGEWQFPAAGVTRRLVDVLLPDRL